ncbi:MAG: hypothetical protein DRR08_09290 [Candidatus Parabeggiatoa sp. nov. 2]|nr:MAG: hypothetical protein DRR08_09290 [Gammaproteobacteria bacterium]
MGKCLKCIFISASIVLMSCNKTSDDTFFTTKVVPILENKCATCHGIEQDSYDKFMASGNEGYFYFPLKEGRIVDVETIYKVSISDDRVDFDEKARFSRLLRNPLTEDYGGIPHKGLDIFYSTDDKDYQTLHTWVAQEIAKNPNTTPELSAHIQFFKDEVQPVFIRNGCFLSSCHGPLTFTDLKLQPPMPDGVFSEAMVRSNRASFLGKVTHFVNLDGDLNRSRLITKNIPIKEGGIHQRGGNNQFFESFADEDVKTILKWLEMEKAEVAAHLVSEGEPLSGLGETQGIVFIRAPRHTPRKYFEMEPFYPGGNIFLLAKKTGKFSSTPVKLTDFENAEIQALDVRYDAKKLVFSMRKTEPNGFRIYELDIATKQITQMSFAPSKLKDGTLIHHIDPIYAPANEEHTQFGEDLSKVSIVYASNQAGAYISSDVFGIIGEADSATMLSISGEVEHTTKQLLYDKQRPEKAGTFTGRRIYFVKGKNAGEWRTIVQHQRQALILDSALPYEVDKNTVYVIEQPHSNYQSAYDLWRFMPGKYEKSNVRMTYGLSQERRPTLRTSGAVMVTTVRNLGYQDDKPIFNGAIYRMQAGGFDFHPHGGERSRFQLQSDSREMPEGIEVRLLHDPRNYWAGGNIALVDHGMGTSTEADNPMDDIPLSEKYDEVEFSSLPRHISEVMKFDGYTHTGVSPKGAFKDHYPLTDGNILVAYTKEKLDHLDPNADPNWDIYTIQFKGSPQSENRRNVGAYELVKIEAASSEELAEYNPRPVMVRLKEHPNNPQHHQKFVKGHQPKEVDGVLRMPEGTPAEIEIYDFGLLASFLTNFTQTGDRNPLPHDAIKYVRVIGIFPLSKADVQPIDDDDPFATAVSKGVHTKKGIVGEVPLEADGSLYVEVPPNVAWIVQALDANKRAVYTLQRMFSTQAGEKYTLSIPRSRFAGSCGGCHGSLTEKPTDGIGPFDIVTEASKVMATWNKQEHKRRNPAAKGAKMTDFISIDYVKDVQPILDKQCVKCHGSHTALDLTGEKTKHYTRSYETLHRLKEPDSGNFADKKYINEREALSSQSALIDLLMTQQHRYLTDEELLTLIRWIDIGATFKGVF